MFRNLKRMGPSMAIAVAIGLVCFSHAQAKKPPKPPDDDESAAYTIVPFLPTELQSVSSQVTDLNETGQAVGFAPLDNSPGGYRAVHLDMTAGEYTLLQDGSHASGVNNRNQIVGAVLLESGSRTAAFWSEPQAAPDLLPLLPGDQEGFAFALNDDGVIVGDSGNRGVVWRVFVDENGDVSFVDGPLPLPPLDGDTGAWGLDVNELVDGSFQVSGHSRGEEGPYEAVVWTIEVNAYGTLVQPLAPVSVGTLGLSDPSGSQASAINLVGDVCGASDGMPYVAPAAETAQPLPVPRNTHSGTAFDINNLGEIVGRLTLLLRGGVVDAPYAYLWKDGEMINLEKDRMIDGDGGWDRLWSANVINDAGIIAGIGRFDVESRGFLLIPNEP